MRRTFAHSTKVRLSFSDRPHAPVNIADSMENADSCSWIQRGDGSQVMKNFKHLRKLGVRSIEEYREASMPFPAFFPLTLLPYYPPCLQEYVACQRSLASLCSYILCMIVKLTYCEKRKKRNSLSMAPFIIQCYVFLLLEHQCRPMLVVTLLVFHCTSCSTIFSTYY